jgi:hypothetical protein
MHQATDQPPSPPLPKKEGMPQVCEGSGRRASDTGAPGIAHGRCEPGPGVSANPSRVVLRLKRHGANRPSPLPRTPWEGGPWAGVYLKGLRGLSTDRAHCSGGPSAPALTLNSAPISLIC